jgi:hypothetical protein
VERDDARVRGAVGALPGDPLIRVLLCDVRVELALDAADVHLPVGVGVILLGDSLDAAHELRERLELGPLVVGSGNGNLDVYGLCDGCHISTLRFETAALLAH